MLRIGWRRHPGEAAQGAGAAVQLQVCHVGVEAHVLVDVRQCRQVRECPRHRYCQPPEQREVLLRTGAVVRLGMPQPLCGSRLGARRTGAYG